jgi:hypothetical protein
MSPLRILAAIAALLVASFGSAVGQSQEHERVSEGQYQKYREGKLTREGNQSWTLWRMPDGGYELEDHFYLGNPAAELAAAVGSQHLSPELRQEMAGQRSQTGVDVKMSTDFRVQSLIVRGTRVLDGKTVELETCLIVSQEIKCKGDSGGAKLNTNDLTNSFSISISDVVVGTDPAFRNSSRCASPTEASCDGLGALRAAQSETFPLPWTPYIGRRGTSSARRALLYDQQVHFESRFQ